MSPVKKIYSDDMDDIVDDQILACLNLDALKSFFLYAGAGSGKTRSLVKAINGLRTTSRSQLILNGQRAAVITYTNAATEEIRKRLDFDPLIEVSTIHSFSWNLINGYHGDIRIWLRQNLTSEIAELEVASRKGRPSKAADERLRTIASKQRRLARIETINKFVYSPTGDNRGKDALNHSEVISITSDFLRQKTILKKILVGRFPILFVDESQDTNKHLMDALLSVQQEEGSRFCLGLFGDVMQRIYSDGKTNLERAIPNDWVTPVKKMNHRCPHRVIDLINRIRFDTDQQEQIGRQNSPKGTVRLFIAPTNVASYDDIERAAAEHMAKESHDIKWRHPENEYKSLVLEHHMAARRMGFSDMYEALNKITRLRTGLLDGSLAGVTFFSKDVLPLVLAMRLQDDFSIAAILRRRSPLLREDTLVASGINQRLQLRKAQGAVEDLRKLWTDKGNPTFLDVLENIAKTQLFTIPSVLSDHLSVDTERLEPPSIATVENAALGDDTSALDEELEGWKDFLRTSFDQIEFYDEYVDGKSKFDTHQGVKGLEFPRVMAVISDEEARGFLFNYEKFFGAKEKSKTDLQNESTGEETTLDRTRRLFYVICSRATSSLAIIAYSENPTAVRDQAIRQKWLEEEEVVMLS